MPLIDRDLIGIFGTCCFIVLGIYFFIRQFFQGKQYKPLQDLLGGKIIAGPTFSFQHQSRPYQMAESKHPAIRERRYYIVSAIECRNEFVLTRRPDRDTETFFGGRFYGKHRPWKSEHEFACTLWESSEASAQEPSKAVVDNAERFLRKFPTLNGAGVRSRWGTITLSGIKTVFYGFISGVPEDFVNRPAEFLELVEAFSVFLREAEIASDK